MIGYTHSYSQNYVRFLPSFLFFHAKMVENFHPLILEYILMRMDIKFETEKIVAIFIQENAENPSFELNE
jgi:hypothetical protein